MHKLKALLVGLGAPLQRRALWSGTIASTCLVLVCAPIAPEQSGHPMLLLQSHDVFLSPYSYGLHPTLASFRTVYPPRAPNCLGLVVYLSYSSGDPQVEMPIFQPKGSSPQSSQTPSGKAPACGQDPAGFEPSSPPHSKINSTRSERSIS
jgi:hypothetical protein